jgi:hypothetical protein
MKIFGLEIVFFKNNIFKLNNINIINTMIRDLHEENRNLQNYIDIIRPMYESWELTLSNEEKILVEEILVKRKKDIKDFENRIKRNKAFILKLQQSEKQ